MGILVWIYLDYISVAARGIREWWLQLKSTHRSNLLGLLHCGVRHRGIVGRVLTFKPGALSRGFYFFPCD